MVRREEFEGRPRIVTPEKQQSNLPSDKKKIWRKEKKEDDGMKQKGRFVSKKNMGRNDIFLG